MTTITENRFALPKIMSCASEELRALHTKMETLQGLIDPTEAKGFDAHQSLQDLDYVTQSLEALSDFFDGLSADTPESWGFDSLPAADRVKLRDIADRLRGKNVPRDIKTLASNDDDYDLF